MNQKDLFSRLYFNIKKHYKISLILIFCSVLYTIIKGIVSIYSGYHNLDLSFNFLKLGYTSDISTKFQFMSLEEVYTMGLNQVLSGTGWLCLSIILSLILGYFIGLIKLKNYKKP
ncbi:MAG: hypothetical protein WC260_02560 [Candidatus Pacearchaeota archaeon]